MMKKIESLLLALSLCLSLAACGDRGGEGDPGAAPAGTGYETEFRCVEQMGRTAVLTADAALTDPYSYTYADPEDRSTYQWVDLKGEYEYTLHSGDIVLVLADGTELSRVVIPYGDIPPLYGYVAGDLLSLEAEDVKAGNQAKVAACDLYDAVNGNAVENYSGAVRIQSVDGEWSGVTEHTGGNDTVYWVPWAELSFDFDTAVLDRAD